MYSGVTLSLSLLVRCQAASHQLSFNLLTPSRSSSKTDEKPQARTSSISRPSLLVGKLCSKTELSVLLFSHRSLQGVGFCGPQAIYLLRHQTGSVQGAVRPRQRKRETQSYLRREDLLFPLHWSLWISHRKPHRHGLDPLPIRQ